MKSKLVIIGGGFGGLNLARKIDKKKWDVVIVDRNNYHSFPPLFYQVASSGLEPASISFPFRRELRRRSFHGVRYNLGTVNRIDIEAHTVTTEFETIPYDKLVIATGTTNNFFGIPDLQKYVYTIKSTSEAIRCRNEILARMEEAAILPPDHPRRKRLLTFVVVGGGPAGVEIAGALGEFKRYIIPREYPTIGIDEVNVILVEGSDALLRTMSPRSQRDASRGLAELMVDVRLGKTMKSYEDAVLSFADGSVIEADTVIWTAGVTGQPVEIVGSDVKPGLGNRWVVDRYCAVVGMPDVYAIGDIALMQTDKYPQGHPQVAQPALQMGAFLAKHLSRGARKPFEYRDKGSMATIGRNRAVVDMGKIHLGGFPAWIAWIFVHLVTLLGMRNRTIVFINWVWNYINFSGGLRLMLRPERYPLRSYWNEKK